MGPRRRCLLVAAAAGVMTLWGAGACPGQLAPTRTYYGRDRAIPMTVDVPEGASGEAEVLLLAPVSAEVVGRAAAAEGTVNLATLFPELWTGETPRVLYAQLAVGGTKVGPAVVMQPMVTPATAVVDAAGMPRFASDATRSKSFTGYRAYADRVVVLETDKGAIELALRPDAAPNTVWSFIDLVEGGFYTDVLFHRVVPANERGEAFVVQTGDPTGTGKGGPGYYTDLENSPLPHDFGVVSMARMRDPDTNGSQFFICLSRGATSFLDGQYTSFAQAVSGGDVIAAIAAVPVGRDDRPIEPVPRIVSARTEPAAPYGAGKRPVVAPGVGPVER